MSARRLTSSPVARRSHRIARFAATALYCGVLASCGGGDNPASPPPPSGNPNVMLSSVALNFGSQLTETTTSQSLTVTNTGTALLQISAISIVAMGASPFQQTNTCGAPILAGGGICTITATFTPISAGAVAAQISIASNAAGSPTFVGLSGTGVARTAVPVVSPAALMFASQIATVSAPQMLTVTNSGTTDLTVSSVTVTGANAADFAQTNTCTTGPVAAASSCTITLTFTPSFSGPEAASVNLVSNAAASPTVVPLTGQSVAGYAYVGGAHGINQYGISNAGTLSPLSPATINYANGGRTSFISVEPTGNRLYAINPPLGGVFQYSFGPGGTLSPFPVNSVYVGGNPSSLAFDLTGAFAYVSIYNDNAIAEFFVEPGGAFSPLTPPTIVGLSESPEYIAVHPVAPYIYVVSYFGITQYSTDSSGQLSLASVWTLQSNLYGLFTVSIDPTGHFAYATSTDGSTVLQFSIGPSGALTPLNPATVATGLRNIYDSPSSVIDPSGKYLYVTGYVTSAVSQFEIGADGLLTPMNPATVAIPGPGPAVSNPDDAFPYAIAIDKTGHFVYIACDDGVVFQYSIGASGGLLPLTPAYAQ
jgi:6-phosphogluconolactonase (cycloisomerase 2 family)